MVRGPEGRDRSRERGAVPAIAVKAAVATVRSEVANPDRAEDRMDPAREAAVVAEGQRSKKIRR